MKFQHTFQVQYLYCMCCTSKKSRPSLHSNLHVNNQLPPWLSSTQDNLTLDLTWIHMYPSEQMKLLEFVVCQFHLVAVPWTIACQSLIRSRQVKSTSPKSREVKQKCAEASLNLQKLKCRMCDSVHLEPNEVHLPWKFQLQPFGFSSWSQFAWKA